MPKDEQTDDPTPPTPEELAELRQAKSDLDAMKKDAVLVFKDGEKSEQVDTSTPEGRKRAAELGSGGFHLAQKAEKLNKEKAALDAQVKDKVEAELKARGQATDAAGEPVDVDKLIEDNPELAQAVEDGEPLAFKKGLAKVLKGALKSIPKPEQPKSAGGVTGDYVDRQIAMRTQILPDPKFQLLATKLGRGDSALGAKKIAEEFKRQVETGTVPADADFAQSYLSVAHAYADELGLKVEAAKPEEKAEEAEPGKENPPKGGGAGAGPGAGPEVPKFKHYDDFLKWKLEKEKKGGNRQHSWRDV